MRRGRRLSSEGLVEEGVLLPRFAIFTALHDHLIPLCGHDSKDAVARDNVQGLNPGEAAGKEGVGAIEMVPQNEELQS